MNQEIQIILDRIESLEDRLTKKIEAVDDKLSQKIEAVDQKIDSVESKLSQEITQVKTAVMEMSEDVEAILDMYKDQHLRLHKLENRFKSLKTAMG